MPDHNNTPHGGTDDDSTPSSILVGPGPKSSAERPAKRQKVTRACDRCKARKRRCNGEMPCTVCQSSGNYCSYNAVYTRGKVVGPLPSSSPQAYRTPTVSRPAAHGSSEASNDTEDAVASFGGQYLGPTSAYSFLKRAWERFCRQSEDDIESAHRSSVDTGRTVSVFAYGDRRMFSVPGDGGKLPDRSVTARLLETYFDYAMPTYRFLYRPDVTSWLEDYHSGTHISPIRQAIVLMVLTTASLFNAVRGFAGLDSDEDALKDAERYFQAARRIVSEEAGKVRLESVQARIAMCLYLLHTSRPNQAWYTFGTTVQMMFVLGMHRKQHDSDAQKDRVVTECRKRAFWAASTLDTYLSIMLGRPSLIHQDDIDQDYPDSVPDEDINNTEIPRGDAAIQATTLHAKIATILKKACYEQYSMHRKSGQRRSDQCAKLNADLSAWKASLPVILSGAVHTSSLMPVFRRQVDVLQLAYSHAVMFINRPFLLTDTYPGANADVFVQEGLTAAKESLESLLQAVHNGTAFNAFWFTQYVAFSALTMVFVWLIQRGRGRLPACGVEYEDNQLLQLAEEIQEHLAKATKTNAPSLRYSAVLSELQQEARRVVVRAGRTSPVVDHFLATTYGVDRTAGEPPASAEAPMGTAKIADGAGPDAFSWEALGKDIPLDPDLWLQLDAFPFCESNVD